LDNGGTITGTNYGILNIESSAIGTITNRGLISGHQAIYNDQECSIATLSNSGTISGFSDAIYNAASASLGQITNSGLIAGTIDNESASDLSIAGGNGTIFGTLTGYGNTIGSIINTLSNVNLSGNQLLNDNVTLSADFSLNNSGVLAVRNPITITGNYAQSAGATLLVDVANGAKVQAAPGYLSQAGTLRLRQLF